ncbi:MAG: hypothetical protein HY200_08940 [Nitrospirae bacterium]|nr:hypothetical protein [Nitrospirota bacterium]MBI3595070.1 hypothetical protein [Nitrospirota bacterium]
MILQSVPIEFLEGYSIWEIGTDKSVETTRFVFEVYFELFSKKYEWEGEFEKMVRDDQDTLIHSTIYGAYSHENSLLATIRIIEKSDQLLPIEKDFNLNILEVCREQNIQPNRIFEIGRLAKHPHKIKKAGIYGRRRLEVIDELIAQVVYSCSQDRENVWVASIDVDVLALLRSRGFHFVPIGKTNSEYLGSPTTPVILSIDQCRSDIRELNLERYEKYFRPMVETASSAS